MAHKIRCDECGEAKVLDDCNGSKISCLCGTVWENICEGITATYGIDFNIEQTRWRKGGFKMETFDTLRERE